MAPIRLRSSCRGSRPSIHFSMEIRNSKFVAVRIMGFWPEVPWVLGGVFLRKCHASKDLRNFHNFQNTLKEGLVNDTEFWPDRPGEKNFFSFFRSRMALPKVEARSSKMWARRSHPSRRLRPALLCNCFAVGLHLLKPWGGRIVQSNP